MVCRLCLSDLSDGNRCEAHIFPRGLLKAMSNDEYGKLLIVGTEMKKRRAPIGSYDTDILCRDCDNKIGVYDDYALSFVKSVKLTSHPSGVGWTASGVNQDRLKLFCISYLWRASITSRDEFRGVSLGSRHEENIRQLLLNDSAGSPTEYTTIFARFESASDTAQGILFPARTRLRNLNFYEGYLPGLYKFWTKVDSQNDPVLSSVSLGDQPDMFVHNRGNFDTSIERSIMVKAVKTS